MFICPDDAGRAQASGGLLRTCNQCLVDHLADHLADRDGKRKVRRCIGLDHHVCMASTIDLA
jgi:hypothetical protein